MANKFTDIATKEPIVIRKGDTIIWKRTDITTDYPTDSYSMSWTARLESNGSTSFDATVTEVDDYYKFTIDNSDSGGLTVGHYIWALKVTQTSDSETLVIDTGKIEVKDNLFGTTGDVRSHAKIMVDKIESILEGKADSDVNSYSIGNRSLSKMSVDELLQWRDYYRAEYNREVRKERMDRGEGTGNTVKVRFDGNDTHIQKYGNKFNW
tara:strand:+ start:14 stop:640 length:627 start_codon:yes stop_codon:yes gene_type:complete